MSVFDYWAPSTAVQRIITGAVVDEWRLRINRDFHEFEFRGPATDVVDSASFASGQGNMTSYPAEPLVDPQSTAVVPGHLGQAWLGSSMTRFGTLTGAEIVVKNNVDARDREFGSPGIHCIAGGERQVFVSFSIHERDNEATRALYQAARSASPVSVMFQLGQQPGQMCGLFLRNVVPQVPEFDDSETKLQWKFGDAQAIGVNNDELFVAFS